MNFRRKQSIIAVVAVFGLAVPAAAVTTQSKQAEPSDLEITQAVEAAMLRDGATPSFLIDAVTVDGIVALDGTVDNVLAKERALEIAKSVEGVRAVVDRVSLAPPLRSDEDIRRDVVNALQSNTATDAQDLKIAVHAGVVSMSGAVDSDAEEELCVEAAKGVAGVTRVDSRLRAAPAGPRPDSEIAEEVNARLESNVWIDSSLIQVAVDGGVVTLSGVVGSEAEKARALINARVSGVTGVKADDLVVSRYLDGDRLRGVTEIAPSTAEIREAVEDALHFDPRVAPGGIEVSVERQTVTLRGTAASAAAKTSAAEDARNTMGVLQVENFLRVQAPGQRPDAAIKSALRTAIAGDPYIHGLEVRANVSGRIATLSGNVRTKFERRQAAELAKNTPGVSRVVNDLTVGEESAAKPDWEIKSAIQTGLYWSPLVKSDDILVTVEHGVATLSGYVGSRRQYETAREIAMEEGARKVNNELIVGGDLSVLPVT